MTPKSQGEEMQMGGGGASAPSTTNEPMQAPSGKSNDFAIAPGTHRPDWKSADYNKLPWQRKLVRVEHYADSLMRNHVHEDAACFHKLIAELERFAHGKPMNENQLNTALDLLFTDRSHPDLWRKAMQVDATPVRGVGDAFNRHDASEMLAKLRKVVH